MSEDDTVGLFRATPPTFAWSWLASRHEPNYVSIVANTGHKGLMPGFNVDDDDGLSWEFVQ